jgi:predicted nucleic acid-binding protein
VPNYLVDTNVAARRVLASDPLHPMIKDAVDALLMRGDVLFVTAQCLIEFQALATRPAAANGLGLPSAEANALAHSILAVFPLLEETPAIYQNWRTLMDLYDVVGRQVFDARLVAVMQTHCISHLLTTNGNHFRRFSEITVVEPASVLGAPANNP